MPSKARPKVRKVLSEFREGKLRSSSGKKVTDRKQAIAIALSEAGMSREKKARSAVSKRIHRTQS